ncbi:GspH/FimT family pseudopilin [Rubrivivax rivuli]|uniref:Type II secretion system protein H n=1 Tax=Rubrivivax rivuli TaxID=1862385 RepID=A0A437RM26_9BURK|nr:GspH/FimT family pseudopilin [Rubrivivax rivuli]RVU47819.1 prepilin-type N-terminal cleavage/methylation domain-containing protein [Rubrivivax rivuli]
MLKLVRARCSPGHRQAARGLTLIELMITIAVLAIGLALAAPTFTQQIANYRLRTASESIINGLNYARAEAVRRNSPVSFTLSDTGSGWTVAQVSPATTLQQRAAGDSPGVSATSTTASRAVTFTATGFVDGSGTRMSQINLASSAANTETRRIDIFGGGLIRACDPAVTAAGDPRRC